MTCSPALTDYTTYNGWANYETWNVALWIQNEFYLYEIAKECNNFAKFVSRVEDIMWDTPDGVSLTDPKLDIEELNEMIDELND